MPERAIFFVDGNNWYHHLREAGFTNLGRLNYAKISQKLLIDREWIATRYYVGRVNQTEDPTLYSAQRRAMSWLEAQNAKIKVIYGRLEPRKVTNDAAVELKQYLADLDVKIDRNVYRELIALANKYKKITVSVEKAVDVKIAVDIVKMAIDDEYDTAYLLSADGDFTPAVEIVTNIGKKIFAVSIGHGAKLAKSVHKFIHLKRPWLNDCFGE